MAFSSLEIYRTTVPRRRAFALVRQLRAQWPKWRITLDVADCDRVLRVQTAGEADADPAAVAAQVRASGYLCEPLPDDDGPSGGGDDSSAEPGEAPELCSRSTNSGI